MKLMASASSTTSPSESTGDDGDNNNNQTYHIPKACRHECTLANGRVLSYYTFDTKPTSTTNNADIIRRPVLYFHGFPSCGLEGAFCANAVADAGGRLYAPDRPGFGHSRHYDATLTDPDTQVQSFVSDLWHFIRQQQWTSFSVIAVSGGGPFATAFLNDYLDKKHCSGATETLPKLEAVSLVACVCFSAGTEGMMKENQTIFNLVQRQDKMTSRLALTFMFLLPTLCVKILPSSWLLKLSPTRNLPAVDQACFSNAQVSTHMVSVATLALCQGYAAALAEAKSIFRSKQGHEESLKNRYMKPSDDYPRISIHQGDLDVNVPKSHAKFIYNDLLCGTPKFVEYPELAHVSLVAERAAEYSRFALETVETTSSK